MIVPLSSYALLVAARGLVGLTSDQGSPDPLVAAMLRAGGLPIDGAWDLAFVHHAGWQAHRGTTGTASAWPFVPSETKEDIEVIARREGAIASAPDVGDVVLWAIGRVGIVARLSVVDATQQERPVYRCKTIEGNVPDDETGIVSRVREMQRDVCPADGDVVVRWLMLDRRAQIGDPVAAYKRVSRAA